MAPSTTPQDRRTKARPGPRTFRITVRGVDLTIPVEKFDDFELLFDIQTLHEDDDATRTLPRLIDVLARFLGVDDARRLISAAKGEGRLGIAEGVGLVSEVFEAVKAVDAPNS
jgi:hypothetical protein